VPLSFLAPWLLAAAAFVVAPLVVHLVNRERRDPTLFPSLMFVSRVPHRAERRRRRSWRPRHSTAVSSC
jgi:hypothetical protein